MGGVEPRSLRQIDVKERAPKKKEDSGSSSMIRRIFGSLKDRFSSKMTPIPEAPQPTPVPEFEGRGTNGAREFRPERLEGVLKLMQNVKEMDMFWEHDFQAFFEKVGQLFDEGCGPQDNYNQRCCVAVIAVAETLHREEKEEGMKKMKEAGAAAYLEWAALNSMDSGVRKLSLLFLNKMGERGAIGRIADLSNQDTATRALARKILQG